MPARILLIDDEDDVLESWELMLEPLGHKITFARNQAEATNACAQHAFDLVIVDYVVKDETGVRILTAVRRRLPLIKSILISGRFEDQITETELKTTVREKVEVDEYLHKPVHAKPFRALVKNLLNPKEFSWKETLEKNKKAREHLDKATEELEEKLKPMLKKKK